MESGRQIFYLTSDPSDVERIQRALDEEDAPVAQGIDLAAVRRRRQAAPSPASLRPAPLRELPAPAGRSPEEYGRALEVPPLDPRRGAAAQHLLHLLWDDLPLLHRLLQSRIERVGPWCQLSRSQAPLARQVRATPGAGEQLDARSQLLEEFCQAWQEGRGRAVDREALERSGLLSERYR